MEESSIKQGRQVQQEIVDNALLTAKAIKEIDSMFSFGANKSQVTNPPQPPIYNQQPQQPQQPGGFPNPQQPQITTPMPPNQMNVNDSMQNTQNNYEEMSKHHQMMSEYHKGIMQISRDLMAMQQDFFQKVNAVQHQLNELQKALM